MTRMLASILLNTHSFTMKTTTSFLFMAAWVTATHGAMTWPAGVEYSFVDPVFTAYNEDFTVDYSRIPEYAKQSVESGVNVILLGGSTAEWPSLTRDERLNLLKAWRAAVDDLDGALKPQILFHAGDISIANAQYLASNAKAYGADAVLIVSPCIMAPSTVEVLVTTIASIAKEAPDLPCIYYHYPALYHVDFPMDEFLALANDPQTGIPTIAGVKFIDSDMKTLTNASGVANASMTLFNNDPLLAGMVAGSKGAISYTNIFPMVRDMHAAFKSNAMEKAREIQRQILTIDMMVGKFGGKSAARNLPMLFGGPALGMPRPPLVGQSPAELAEFKAALESTGFLPKKN